MRVLRPPHPPVEAVTFDAAGTLFHLAEPVGDTYSRIASYHGWKLSPASLESAFRAAWKEAPPFGTSRTEWIESPNDRERSWWRSLVEATFLKAGDTKQAPISDDLFEALFQHYATGEAWRLYPETLDVLKASVSHLLSLGVISNFDRRFHQIARHLEIDHFFDSIVLSGEIGRAKPDPLAFQTASTQLNLPPELILHVGDDPEADWLGAGKAGFQVMELSRPSQSLEDLIPLLPEPG